MRFRSRSCLILSSLGRGWPGTATPTLVPNGVGVEKESVGASLRGRPRGCGILELSASQNVVSDQSGTKVLKTFQAGDLFGETTLLFFPDGGLLLKFLFHLVA